MDYAIYKYTFPNGKHYIGQTINRRNRHNQHGKESSAVSKAIKVLGKPKQELIEVCETLREALDREKLYIQLYDSGIPFGYNSGVFSQRAWFEDRYGCLEQNRHRYGDARRELSRITNGRLTFTWLI